MLVSALPAAFKHCSGVPPSSSTHAAAAIAAAVPAVASASKTRGEYGYFLLDTDAQVDTDAIAALPGVLRVRVLHQ